MFFVLSKILFFALSPVNMAIYLLSAAMVALYYKRHALARKLGFASWAVLIVFGVLPVGQSLTAKLESAYPYPAELPRRVDGIILLGGFIDTDMGLKRGTPQVDGAVDRLNTFVDMAQRYPYARLVFTAGQGTLGQNGVPEGQMVKTLLERMRAYTRTRLVIEDQSRTTYENAALSYDMVKPQAGETWLLVTSAWHMPRAVGVFNSVGWNVVPVPSDYMTDGITHGTPGYRGFLGNLALSQTALKEYGGMAVYALTGKWKPSPKVPTETHK